MCSVRQRPMPAAPKSRATRASFGVSAFVRTPRVRISSAHFRRRSKLRKVSDCSAGSESFEQHLDDFGRPRIELAADDLAGRAVDRNEVAFFERLVPFAAQLALAVVDAQRAGADDARPPHAARDDGRVRGEPAARGEDARRAVHAGDVLGRRLDAHEDDRAVLRHRHGVLGVERDAARRGAGSGRKSAAEDASAGERFLFFLRVETPARASCTICPASTRDTASVWLIRPSSTMSQAIFTAAKPVRLPVRVCRR